MIRIVLFDIPGHGKDSSVSGYVFGCWHMCVNVVKVENIIVMQSYVQFDQLCCYEMLCSV